MTLYRYTYEQTQELSEQDKEAKLNFVKLKCKYTDNNEVITVLLDYERCHHEEDWSWFRVNNAARFSIIEHHDRSMMEACDHMAERFFR